MYMDCVPEGNDKCKGHVDVRVWDTAKTIEQENRHADAVHKNIGVSRDSSFLTQIRKR